VVAVLQALMAVRALRQDRGADLDRYYLRNLGSPTHLVCNGRRSDPDAVPEVIADLIRILRESGHVKEAALAGHTFFTALRDEVVSDGVALHRALNPFLDQLFRLAARGHWIRERRPIRMPGEYLPQRSFEPLSVERFCVIPFVSKEGDLELGLAMHDFGVTYPMGPYPEILEFGAMLHQLEAGQVWDGMLFQGSGEMTRSGPRFHFSRRADRVLFTFPEQEWNCLKKLFATLLGSAEVQSALDRLSLEYGDI